MLKVILMATTLILSTYAVSWAAENEVAQKAAVEKQAKPKAAVKNDQFKVFKPSEEISEDLSVPFPTDI